MTVRIAIVGCGNHGRRGHLEAYRQVIAAGEDAAVVAVCDQDGERARAAAEEFRVPCWYSDLQPLLDVQRVDAVSIATPPAMHCRQTLAALAAGAHVLCEKPLAMNAAEAEEMVAAANRAGRVLTMGLQHRHTPGARYLRQLLAHGDAGELGRIYHTRLWWGHVLRPPPATHFFTPELAGGGVLAATAVHALDEVLWLLGNPAVASVCAATYAKVPRMAHPPAPWDDPHRLAGYRVEDFAFALVRFASGSTLSLETNWMMHPTGRPQGAQFLGDRGVAEYNPVRVRLDDGGQVQDITPPQLRDPAPSRPHQYFVDVVRDFLRAVRTGTPALVTGDQMVQVQAVLDACYTSARTGQEVRLDSTM